MKNTFTLFFIFFIIQIHSQIENSQPSISSGDLIIYSNTNKNTNLFFSSPIKSGIVGNSNFTLGYSPNVDSKIGILKATPGAESNLLVITTNGNIYSFIIRYKEELTRLNYFIKDDMAIGNENGNVIYDNTNAEPKGKVVSPVSIPILNNNIDAITVNDYQTIDSDSTQSSVEKFSNLELKKSVFYNRIYGSKNKITVKLKNITYIENDLYFSLVLRNDSNLDYDINYLNFYIISRNKKRNTVTQTIPYTPIYIHNFSDRISANEENEVVFVYNKFTINENKILLIELTEDNGERTIQLEIPNTFINNPNQP